MSAISSVTSDTRATDAWKATGPTKTKAPPKSSTPEILPFGQPAALNYPSMHLYYHDGKIWRPVPAAGLKKGQTYQFRIYYNGVDKDGNERTKMILIGFQHVWGSPTERTLTKFYPYASGDFKILIKTETAANGSSSVRMYSSLNDRYKISWPGD